VPLEYRILGSLEVFHEGRALALGGPRQRALLAALLVRANRVVLDDLLGEELWPSATPQAALRSLHVYVHKLRGALGDADLLERVGPGYRLVVAPGHLDAERFESLVASGRGALAAGDAAGAADRLKSALALWRGPALAGLADSGAAMDESRRLDEERLQATEDSFDAELALGEAADVVAGIEALVAAHPERERPWGQLMVALYRLGRQSEALAAYHKARDALDEVGLAPGPALREIEGAILRQDPSLLVEQADLRARRHLPAPRTPLVGRRDALDDIGALVRGGARLVTLVGPGGVGKTRLALQAAHELADRFAAGVWFVDLSPLRDPGLVAAAVAGTVGAAEAEGRDARAAVLHWLRDRDTLLVLDNLEQIDDAAPFVGEMLTAASGLMILATSRTPLRLYGEYEYPVKPLRLSDEAVPLFVGRARAVRRSFAASPEATSAIEEICRALDSLPLAIELAAARSRELSLEEMLEMLSRRLSLPGEGPRDVPERQRALRAAIGWSYDLLPSADRRRFSRLAVFAGGCFPDAAAAVCGDDDFGALVDRSLVAVQEVRGIERLTMLETVREFALEVLEGAAEENEARSLHAGHFFGLAEASHEAFVSGTGADDVLDLLAADHDNLREALGWCRDHDPALFLRFASRLRIFWHIRGHFAEGRQWMQAALNASSALGDNEDGAERVKALHALGVLCHRQGDGQGSIAAWTESRTLATALGDTFGAARALGEMGNAALSAGDLDRAEALLEESAATFRGLGDDLRMSACLCNLADLHLQRGDAERALDLASQALAIDEALENRDDMANALNNLGRAELLRGRHGEAEVHFRRALDAATQIGYAEMVAYSLYGLAEIGAALGRSSQAALIIGWADAHLGEIGALLQPLESGARDQTVRALGSRLGADRVTTLRAEGAGLPMDDAVAIALGRPSGTGP
jgi:predicted ATPase/DNA-binding SARP family transcriptional activator